MSFEIQLKGSKELLRALDRLGPEMREYGADGLEAEADIELKEAQNRTPFRTGALRRSAYRRSAVVDRGGVSVTLGFGGPTAPYAPFVHEQLRPHDIGRAKFLESAVVESARYLTVRVARRIRERLDRRHGR
jgi:hypothetical protein